MDLKTWLKAERIPVWAFAARIRVSPATVYRLMSNPSYDVRFSIVVRIVRETGGAVTYDDLSPRARKHGYKPPQNNHQGGDISCAGSNI